MVYGNTYKQSLRNPTEDEKKLISRAIPQICMKAKIQFEDTQRTTLILIAVPIIALVFGLIRGWFSIITCFLPGLICCGYMVAAYDNYKNTKKHTAKMHAGKYLIASGMADHCEVQKDKYVVIGEIGTRKKQKIKFLISSSFISDKDCDDRGSFLCVIINQSAYVVAKLADDKIVVADDVEVYSFNTNDTIRHFT